MTTSTDKNETPIKKEKTKKSKGPFRTGLLAGLTVLIVLSIGYFKFFFDGNMRRGLEWSLSHLHGAEVNIQSFNTSFINADLEIRKVEITDKEKPEQNVLQIDSMKFKFLWDALLRGKIVVDESSINQISLYTPRKSAGIILPKSEQGLIQQSKTLTKGKEEALSVVKEKFNANALGDVASLLDGTDTKTYADQLKETLASEKKIKEIENLINSKKSQWDKRINDLPKEAEFKTLIDKVKRTKINKNPLRAAKQIKEIAKTIKKGKQNIKQYSAAAKGLEQDIKLVKNQYSSIDKVINEDVKNLESRFNIPEIDATSLSLAFFSKMIGQNENKVKKYVGIAQEYMPKKGHQEAKNAEHFKPKARGKGVNIKFPVTIGYPKFWLKKSVISSVSNKNSGLSGDLSGTLTNVTDDPIYIKKPAILEIKGDFPKQGFRGVDLKLAANHHLSQPNETFKFAIKNYPVKGITLSSSSKVGITMVKANSHLSASGVNNDKGVSLSLRNNFNHAKFKVKSSSSKTKKILQAILKDINSAYLLAKATGHISHLNWDISSNIGHKISSSLKSLLQKKINNLKQKLRSAVEEKVNAQKAKLKGQIAHLENQYKGRINAQKGKAQAKLKELSNAYSQKSNQRSNKLLKKGKAQLKKLFKF